MSIVDAGITHRNRDAPKGAIPANPGNTKGSMIRVERRYFNAEFVVAARKRSVTPVCATISVCRHAVTLLWDVRARRHATALFPNSFPPRRHATEPRPNGFRARPYAGEVFEPLVSLELIAADGLCPIGSPTRDTRRSKVTNRRHSCPRPRILICHRKGLCRHTEYLFHNS